MTAAHRVVMNTGILYARMVITVVLSLYTTRLTLAALGAEDFGIFNLVGGTIAMLTFLNASMAAATQRFMSFAQGQGDEGRQHQIFNVSVVLHAGIALLVLALLEGVGFWLFNDILKIEPERMQAAWLVYQFAAASTFFTILAVPYDAVINAREHMLLFAVLGVIEAVLKLAIALVITQAAADRLELYGQLMAVLSVVLLLLRVGYCHRKYHECKLALRRHFSRPLFKEMTAFAGWSFLGSSTSMLANYGQGVVLNIFFGAKLNTAQGIAAQVAGQLGVFSNVMLRALNPLIAKSEGGGNRVLMLKASMSGSKVSFFLLALLYVPVIVEMPYIFRVWLEDIPDYTISFCYLLLIRNLIEQLYISIAPSISAVGNIRAYQIVASLLTLFPLPATFLLYQQGLHPQAMYFVYIGYAISMFLATLYFSKKICNLSIRDYIKNVVFRCFSVLAISITVSMVPILFIEQGLLRLLVVGMISVSTTLALIWSIGLCKDEKLIVASMLSILLRRFQKSTLKIYFFAKNSNHFIKNKHI